MYSLQVNVIIGSAVIGMAKNLQYFKRGFQPPPAGGGVYIDCVPPPPPRPQHLICFKDWTSEMIMKILYSALALKDKYPDSRGIQLPILNGCKVMILQEVNFPVLHLAVSKAATFMGAHDVNIIDHVVWEHDYMGRVFSEMADVIFVSTSTHQCIERFAKHSTAPVLCMQSRAHAAIQSLAAVMCIFEEFGQMKDINLCYLGPPHPIINSFLLLCPMLGANIKYKCSCDKFPLTPLLYKVSEEMCNKEHTKMSACDKKGDVFDNVDVIVAGPTPKKECKLPHFTIDINDITKGNKNKDNWIFMHVCPRGPEVKDDLFFHKRARTYKMFNNMQYIAAALMVYSSAGFVFGSC